MNLCLTTDDGTIVSKWYISENDIDECKRKWNYNEAMNFQTVAAKVIEDTFEASMFGLPIYIDKEDYDEVAAEIAADKAKYDAHKGAQE